MRPAPWPPPATAVARCGQPHGLLPVAPCGQPHGPTRPARWPPARGPMRPYPWPYPAACRGLLRPARWPPALAPCGQPHGPLRPPPWPAAAAPMAGHARGPVRPPMAPSGHRRGPTRPFPGRIRPERRPEIFRASAASTERTAAPGPAAGTISGRIGPPKAGLGACYFGTNF